MKWRGKYLVWVLVALLVLLLAYSWNSREYFENQCWSQESPMSETTGFVDVFNDSKIIDFAKYVGRKEIEAGRCGRVGRFGQQIPDENCAYNSQLLLSPDVAKEYCSTKNCTAIIKAGPSGISYFPVMSPLRSTLPPEGVQGIESIILPLPCPPAPPTPTPALPLAAPSPALPALPTPPASVAATAANQSQQPPRTFTCTAN